MFDEQNTQRTTHRKTRMDFMLMMAIDDDEEGIGLVENSTRTGTNLTSDGQKESSFVINNELHELGRRIVGRWQLCW